MATAIYKVKKKRKRKVKLALCPTCGSFNITGHFGEEYDKITGRSSFRIQLHCSSCKWDNKIDIPSTQAVKGVVNAQFEQELAKLYKEVRSPHDLELTFIGFRFNKKKEKWAKNSREIFVYATDSNGLRYRFSGESGLKVLYYTVKDKKFKANIAIQKHWTKARRNFLNIKEGTITNFRQSPKVIGNVELIV